MYYFRMKNGKIMSSDTILNWFHMNVLDFFMKHKEEISVGPKKTIEELIQDGDMLYINDLYPDTVLVVGGNIKPFGYNDKIKLSDWLNFEHTKFDLYIKDSKENFYKVAKKEEYKKLELI